jgi:hypothetical protein
VFDSLEPVKQSGAIAATNMNGRKTKEGKVGEAIPADQLPRHFASSL